MVKALIGLGSNINPEANLKAAAKKIREQFHGCRFSDIFKTAPVGMGGDDFLNACCLISTDQDQESLIHWMKSIEEEQKRDQDHGSWSPRTLDLDLLMYGNDYCDPNLLAFGFTFVPASQLIALQGKCFELGDIQRYTSITL